MQFQLKTVVDYCYKLSYYVLYTCLSNIALLVLFRRDILQ